MNQITPYRPLPYRSGNKVIQEYTELTDCGGGFMADITYVDFIDKNSKLNEKFVMYIKWRE